MAALNNRHAPFFRQWREDAGVSPKDMASKVGMDVGALGKLEQGHAVSLSPKHMGKLIEVYFGVQAEKGWPMHLRRAFFLWDEGFGTELARRRKAVHLLQSELAKRAKVRWETLNRLEQGKHKPRMETLKTIIDALESAEKEYKKLGYVPESSLAERFQFAKELKKMRTKAGMEVEDLVEASGMGIESILSIEAGRRTPHPTTLKRLKKALQKGKSSKRR
jgi:transcriptional regulator with XRE-family HTH domain